MKSLKEKAEYAKIYQRKQRLDPVYRAKMNERNVNSKKLRVLANPQIIEKDKEYSHNHYIKNREKVLARQKKYLSDNPDKKESRRMYYKIWGKEYRVKNKDKIFAYILKNKVHTAEYGKMWRAKNKEKIAKRVKDWQTKNKCHIQNIANVCHKKRYYTDINYRLKKTLRVRIHSAIKQNQKKGSAVRDLGCTIDELKFYLEGQFQDGMTWENWSLKGWHIDHKIPLAFFDLTDREQFLKACHYTNLQPLWAKENIMKRDKILTTIKSWKFK